MAGTTEFTGFTIMAITASGQNFAHASTMPLAMPAFVLKRSSRVMPGLRGTPAGMKTRWHPVRHSSRCSISFLPNSMTKPLTVHFLSKWPKSAATPAGGTAAMLRSKMFSSLTFGSMPMRRDRFWPMPPAPPQTQTLYWPGGFGSFFGALALALTLAFALGSAFALALPSAFALALPFALASGSAAPFAFFFLLFTTLHPSQYSAMALFLYLPL
mmetsp:Transcript_17646/g.39838  ORF Transcript_17646/g.39838 Transcript_17646/m.39838 type:complete len:214 (+) Transcript_17646:204-845(+)